MKKVLIIDDDESFCAALQRAMQRRQFEVMTATTTAQALELATLSQVENAVVDLRIGEESGLKIISELLGINRDMNIVMLTGYASITTAVQAIKLGAAQYLTKPAEADAIVEALQHHQADDSAEISTTPMSPRRLEWEHIQSVLAQNEGNISATARALGIHRRSLQRKLQKRPARQ